MGKSNIEQLSLYLKNDKARKYPIQNEMLESGTDFVLNGYLKMLAVILQQPGEIMESQLLIYKRIVAGTKTDSTTEDYLRMALSVEIDDYIKFIAELKEMELKYRFVFDAMILTCVNNDNAEQILLVAEFIESLELNKEEVEYLASIARAIVCMDTEAYVDANEIKKEGIPDNTFFGYVRLLAKECILNNQHMTIFQPTCEEEVTVERLNQISTVNTECVKLSHVKVDLAEYRLNFECFKKVILEEWEFIGGSKYAITFKFCEEIIIKNCYFHEFYSRTLEIYRINTNSVRITNSRFENCSLKYENHSDDWGRLGGVIHVLAESDGCPIVIDKSSFCDCGGRNASNYYRSAFICDYACEVNNSHFERCWHHNSVSVIDPENRQRTMFAPGSKAIRCVYKDSALFC